MRPTIDEYFMNIAEVVATRSTCLRNQVGAVIVLCAKMIINAGIVRMVYKNPYPDARALEFFRV